MRNKRKSFCPVKLKPKLKIATFDIETKNWVYPYCLSFYDGENIKMFTGNSCITDFLNFVITKKYRAYSIFAHNGGKFDFNFIIEHLKKMKYDIHFIFQGSRCILLKIYEQKEGKLHNRKACNNIKFYDSYALLRFSLDKLTKSFNVSNKKLNFMGNNEKNDYDYLYKLYKNKDKKFYEYVKNDVVGLYQVLNKFQNLKYIEMLIDCDLIMVVMYKRG